MGGKAEAGKRRSGARLPAPLVPADCDLRGINSMMLNLGILDSDLAALSTGEEFKAAILLYGASYSQVPAGSLPDEPRTLAFLSHAGAAWSQIKDMALRGWIKCSDGRLYHPVMALEVLYAWIGRLNKRLAGRAGSDKTWKNQSDPAAIQQQLADTMRHIHRLAPDFPPLVKWLKKNPDAIRDWSQRDRSAMAAPRQCHGNAIGSAMADEWQAEAEASPIPSQGEGGLRVIDGGAP